MSGGRAGRREGFGKVGDEVLGGGGSKEMEWNGMKGWGWGGVMVKEMMKMCL